MDTKGTNGTNIDTNGTYSTIGTNIDTNATKAQKVRAAFDGRSISNHLIFLVSGYILTT